MGYLFLLLTIIAETGAVLLMKASGGFRDKWYASMAVTGYILSFVFLTLALKHIPVGLGNAIWAGASTVLVLILGVVIFKEQVSVAQLIFLSFIVIGLIGLSLSKT